MTAPEMVGLAMTVAWIAFVVGMALASEWDPIPRPRPPELPRAKARTRSR